MLLDGVVDEHLESLYGGVQRAGSLAADVRAQGTRALCPRRRRRILSVYVGDAAKGQVTPLVCGD
jgi:hypothetical protein